MKVFILMGKCAVTVDGDWEADILGAYKDEDDAKEAAQEHFDKTLCCDRFQFSLKDRILDLSKEDHEIEGWHKLPCARYDWYAITEIELDQSARIIKQRQ